MLRLFWLPYHICKSSWINQWHLSDRKSFCSFPANFKRQLIKSLKCRQEQRGLNIWGEEGERGSVGSSLICFLPNSSPFTWPCQLPAWGDLCQSLPNSLRNSYRGQLCLCCAPFTPLSFSNVPPRSPNLLSGFASSGVQLCKVLSMQNKFYTCYTQPTSLLTPNPILRCVWQDQCC